MSQPRKAKPRHYERPKKKSGTHAQKVHKMHGRQGPRHGSKSGDAGCSCPRSLASNQRFFSAICSSSILACRLQGTERTKRGCQEPSKACRCRCGAPGYHTLAPETSHLSFSQVLPQAVEEAHRSCMRQRKARMTRMTAPEPGFFPSRP